ncbi:unnamed protein product [Zymoseptoria tritici ST99CH_3D1]|nr:unnamed protein product [Zymoseptoria tritici ST99CH_3D1]
MSPKQSTPAATTTTTNQHQPTTTFSLKSTATLLALLALVLALYTPLRSALPKLISTTTPTAALLANRTSTLANNRTMSSTTSQPLKVILRPHASRGHADHGWLYTFHTFSFASYYDPHFESLGPLRVINEDRVAAGRGFGAHPHAEFGIWSYIVRGALGHKDSMGNFETLKRGEVQFTNAGTGIRHAEMNGSEDEEVHFLQIWAKPNVRGTKPSYCTREYTDAQKEDKLVRIMEGKERHSGKDEPSEPIEILADLSMDASILSPGKSVTHELVKEGEREVYVHLVMGGRTQPKVGGARIRVGGVELGEGDGAFVKGAKGPGVVEVESVGDRPAEFLVFDMGRE